MFFLLAVTLVFARRYGTQASCFAAQDQPTLSPNNDLQHSRTVWSIICSCLVTIFTCTWVAIHPNIPSPRENKFAVISCRAKIMVLALIMPEFIIMWAIRQWIAARKVAETEKDRGWTQVHGFFTIMGGFVLFDGDKALYPLTPKRMESLVRGGQIVFPDITEDEIKDRSKGDALSKCLVVAQTGWFVLQCIARSIQHLPVTELELVTLAFASLNLATYVFWWHKAQNVQCPVRVVTLNPVYAGVKKREGATSTSMLAELLDSLRNINGARDEHIDLAAGAGAKVPIFMRGIYLTARISWHSILN